MLRLSVQIRVVISHLLVDVHVPYVIMHFFSVLIHESYSNAVEAHEVQYLYKDFELHSPVYIH
ncbi:unnamed protein product [Schistosoma mattheei]|uniref:Uncharacterized protein n=1 Tax=Schistosoma mattheei TaxID=31246 RepID=A0A183PQK0_9TREM|nr:unnamed protein product [Schistosoma mattheei]